MKTTTFPQFDDAAEYAASYAARFMADTDDEPYEPGICPHCNGSGEGQNEGSRCNYCKGMGEL